MDYRTLGRTGWKISGISFGAWAIGGAWGNVDDQNRWPHCTPRSTVA